MHLTKKQKVTLLVIVLTLNIFLLYIVINLDDSKIKEEVMPQNCQKFDAKEFLLTGGTGTPQTFEEIVQEFERLDNLCYNS